MVTHPVHSLPLNNAFLHPDVSQPILLFPTPSTQPSPVYIIPPLPQSQALPVPLHRKPSRATQLAVRLLARDIGTPTVSNPRRPTRNETFGSLSNRPWLTNNHSQIGRHYAPSIWLQGKRIRDNIACLLSLFRFSTHLKNIIYYWWLDQTIWEVFYSLLCPFLQKRFNNKMYLQL